MEFSCLLFIICQHYVQNYPLFMQNSKVKNMQYEYSDY